MRKRTSLSLLFVTLGLVLSTSLKEARALELDWKGQFWSEFNSVLNIGPVSQQNAVFESVFLRLQPTVVVNDNVYIKSEWWVGDPIFGIFGSGLPYSGDQRQYYSNQSRGFPLSVQRVWGEFLTDLGTFQVGRVPLQWGLGVVWNSGDRIWDRYMSTGDAVRWIAKFGSFSFIPSLIVTSAGNSIGSACTVSNTGLCVAGSGYGGATDYSLIFKYENIEDELEIGANLVKRIAGANQDSGGGILTPPQSVAGAVAQSMNYFAYDLYARKKLDKFSFGVEVPISSGSFGSTSYQTLAVASEIDYKPTDNLSFALKAGYAPGQNSMTTAAIDVYKPFYFNPNYHIGMIMFNYQLANFSGAQTRNNPNLNPSQLSSPYDNPIVNATYLAVSSQIRVWDKWTFKPGIVYAQAPQVVKSGEYGFNYLTKTVQQNTSGSDQNANLGFEVDLGVSFQWDESFQLSLDNGLFFPGGFYAYSGTSNSNTLPLVFATSLRAGVTF